ncbi:MAG: glycosyltransferase family 4 protein [Nocardioides sp.]|uniref:glycosyltransferase family 4 protein n=1 Tax=Nocardioides sp. TaxID=35761 RepID=UPI0039E35824
MIAAHPRPTVLHVTEAYGGGTMNVIHDYAAATPELRHVVLAALRDGEDTGVVPPPDVVVTRLPRPAVAALRALRRTVSELEPDIVHAHSSRAGGLVRLTPGLSRARIVYTPHCFAFERQDLGPAARAVLRGAEALLARRTALLVGVSPREVALGRALGRRAPGVYVPNVAARPEPAAEAGPTPVEPSHTAVTVGRIGAQKDPSFFAEVARATARTPGPPVRFVWYGDGDPAGVRSLRAAGVEVTGWLPRAEVLRRTARAGAYLHTARWESAPLTVLEAAAVGLPLVLRRSPALAGLGLPGLIDTPPQAAARLRSLLPAVPDPGAHAALLAGHTPARQRAALLEAYSRVSPRIAAHRPTTAAP